MTGKMLGTQEQCWESPGPPCEAYTPGWEVLGTQICLSSLGILNQAVLEPRVRHLGNPQLAALYEAGRTIQVLSVP